MWAQVLTAMDSINEYCLELHGHSAHCHLHICVWYSLEKKYSLWNLSIGDHNTKGIMYEIVFHDSVGRRGGSQWGWGIHLSIQIKSR